MDEKKVDQIKIKITEMNALLAGSTNQLSAENKTKLRTLATETQALIKETHKTLGDAVKSLREAMIKYNEDYYTKKVMIPVTPAVPNPNQ